MHFSWGQIVSGLLPPEEECREVIPGVRDAS